MKKVLFLCNWGESPAQILERYKRQTPGSSGIWKEIMGVKNPDEADVFIILEGLEKGVEVDPERAIYIKREPDYIQEEQSHPFARVVRWSEGHCGVVWWLSKTYDELLGMPYPEKPLRLSCVVSSKHRFRKRFIQSLFGKKYLLGDSDLKDADLFGRGHSRLRFGASYKGELGGGGNCKLDGLLPYRYTLALENSRQRNYWTEKLADAYLSWTVPVYWGCPNIEDYFNEETIRSIDLDTGASEIEDIVSRPIEASLVELLAIERKKILEQYNIWEVVRNNVVAHFG